MPAPLVYHVATSLDGFIADADGGFAAFPTTGAHIPDYVASLAGYGSVVMGRATYQVGLAQGVTNPYPMLRSYVLSSSLGASPDPAVTVVPGDAAAFVRDLRAREERPIYLCGGGKLAAALFAARLIDTVIAKQNPLLFGTGIPLFAGALPATRLVLRDARVYASGVIVSTYDVGATI